MSDVRSRILQLMNDHPDSDCDIAFGPVPSVDVTAVENEVRVRFPVSFRGYLEAFAGGKLFGFEIAGVPTARSRLFPDSDENIIFDIVAVNRELAIKRPNGHVAICTDDGHNWFFLDSSALTPKGKCPVLMYGPNADFTQIADDFLHLVSLLANPARGRFV